MLFLGRQEPKMTEYEFLDKDTALFVEKNVLQDLFFG